MSDQVAARRVQMGCTAAALRCSRAQSDKEQVGESMLIESAASAAEVDHQGRTEDPQSLLPVHFRRSAQARMTVDKNIATETLLVYE